MAKYNIVPKKNKAPLYRSLLSHERVEELYERIMEKFVVEKKYRDPSYSTIEMAKELGTNVRYISAAINMRFQDNYSQLVNDFRIREAMYLLRNYQSRHLNMEQIGQKVGFVNRQSFYAAFYRRNGITPRQYRQESQTELESKLDEHRQKIKERRRVQRQTIESDNNTTPSQQ